MNRREALLSALDTVVAAVPCVATAEAVEAERPLMVKVKLSARLEASQLRYVQMYFTEKLKGTELEGVPVFILQPEVDIEVVDDPRV